MTSDFTVSDFTVRMSDAAPPIVVGLVVVIVLLVIAQVRLARRLRWERGMAALERSVADELRKQVERLRQELAAQDAPAPGGEVMTDDEKEGRS